MAPHSLPALLTISQHKYLAPKIDTLRLGTQYLDEEFSNESFDDELEEADRVGDFAGRVAILEQRKKFCEYFHAQLRFREGHDNAILTAILACLSNLRHVEVGEWLEGREDVQRPCYGMAIVKATTGRDYSDDTLTGSPNVQDDLSSGGLGHFGLHHNFRAVLWALSLPRRQAKSLSAQNWPTRSPLNSTRVGTLI